MLLLLLILNDASAEGGCGGVGVSKDGIAHKARNPHHDVFI